MKTSSILTSLAVFVTLLLITSCNQAGSGTDNKPNQPVGLTGTYSGKNSLGYEYKIEFISATDCLITDPRRGHGPATYRIVEGHMLITLPGGSSDLILKDDTLSFTDDGYPVVLTKNP